MPTRPARTLAPLLLLALLGAAHAFEWEPFAFEAVEQAYTIEIFQGEGAEVPDAVVDVEVVPAGDAFDVTTTMTFEQHGVAADDLEDAMWGGGAAGMFAMGPMLMFGPTFMMLPMLLDGEDVAVRSEPTRVLGVGTMHMDREVEIAGHRCVVVRLEPQAENGATVEFALAEDLPLPCYTRYGTGEGATEVRLVRAE